MADEIDKEAVWPDPAEAAYSRTQARELRAKAKRGGLKFEAYLPPGDAVWLLDLIESGAFIDPSEATFVLLGQARELEPHTDLRSALLKRRIQAAIDDPHPGIPGELVFEKLKKEIECPLPESAVWVRRTRDAE